MFGIAIDLGTTNIAASLVDLERKRIISTTSRANSQRKYGFDVVTRLNYSSTRKAVKTLQKLVVSDINQLITKLAGKDKRSKVRKVCISGNTVMLHFLFGLDISGLLRYPYKSKIMTFVKQRALSLGIKLDKKVFIESLPIISPYLGADIVAGLYQVGMFNKKNVVFVDLGTNAEVVVASKSGIFATSAAAGPAFKSRMIPLGSKLISKTAELLRKKYIDSTGKILKSCNLEQKDIRSLQVAKAAIYSAMKVLLGRAKLKEREVKLAYIAGIFGDSLKLSDALKIKLFPAFLSAKTIFLGDAALNGTIKYMVDNKSPKDLIKLIKKVNPVELNQEKGFQTSFINAMKF